MSKCSARTRRRGDAETRRERTLAFLRRVAASPRPRVILLTLGLLLSIGCRQDMQDQPRYEAYESSSFFKDGLSSRPIVEGTVPRGYLRADRQLYTGKMQGASAAQGGGPRAGNANENANQGGQEAGAQANNSANTAGGAENANAQGGGGAAGAQGGAGAQGEAPAGEPDDADTFPFPVTAEVVARGRERYEIFCAMCHGPTGAGDGMIVRRGYRQPPSYHENRLRQARVGYFFRVITEGFGAMPPYKSQVPVQDRWAIAAYIRALQMSQMNQQLAPAHNSGGGAAESGGHR
jgi:cytochrome c553